MAFELFIKTFLYSSTQFSAITVLKGPKISLEPFLLLSLKKSEKEETTMATKKSMWVLIGILMASTWVFGSTAQSGAETLVQSTADTRLMVAMRVGQAELQKLVPAPWQVIPIPGGPLKEANFFVVFIDSFLVQDAQGKPDKGGITRKVVFAVPAKHTQTGEMATVVTGGFTANIDEVPGPYKNFVQATIRREQTYKEVNTEAGVGEDFWEVRDTREGVIELRIQYQQSPPLTG